MPQPRGTGILPPMPLALPPAVVVHATAEAAAALAHAGPAGATLLSAPGAAGSLGPAWFLALVAGAAAAHPAVPHLALLDCAEAPGQALAALRAGLPALVLDPTCAAFPALAAAAAECGALLLPERPSALDLGRLDLRRPGGRGLLAQWLVRGR
ncbi:hypothetical protein [Siccirubricoccus phaeus]|uniref:hypothetical protein n=1 Tax=Siccirubricoccus phaeus TaxID=2595053 RepID=UPI0011F37D77|nr:hypothetical protein [Siccirubricoccus phaeus]